LAFEPIRNSAEVDDGCRPADMSQTFYPLVAMAICDRYFVWWDFYAAPVPFLRATGSRAAL
jgi:hypothetical protein